MSFVLRPYQRAACDAYYEFLKEGGISGLIELATGLGKSLVNATICKELIGKYPNARILCIVHSRELIVQNLCELMRLWPSAPAGINSAGIGRRDWRAQILFCGIQSVHKHASLIGHADLVIIDECHLLSRKSAGMYQRFLAELRDVTPDLRLCGLTATPYRLDSGRLDEGEDKLFDKTVYSYGIGDGIRDGYLSPLISKAMLAEIDTAGVHLRGGEFIEGELERAAMAGDNVTRAVDEIIERGRDRKKWLAFCVGIKHAEAVTAALKERGIAADIVTGETPKVARDARIASFKRGELRCLVNVMVLTTGFNVPGVDMIALLRPTQSPGLAIQQIGRLTRPMYADGFDLDSEEGRRAAIANGPKSNGLVLDFASILKTHGPVDRMAPPSRDKPKRKRTPKPGLPVRICPECNGITPLTAKICDQCGNPFPKAERDETRNDAEADGIHAVLSTQQKPRWLHVRSWRFSVHQKEGRPQTLRVRYYCDLLTTVGEFWCFEHGGFAKVKAHQRWHELRCYDYERSFFVPQTCAEALDNAPDYLECPMEIMVQQNGKYFEVVRVSRNPSSWGSRNAA